MSIEFLCIQLQLLAKPLKRFSSSCQTKQQKVSPPSEDENHENINQTENITESNQNQTSVEPNKNSTANT